MKEENEPEEVEFNWEDYLKQTSSEAAPKSCFTQHEVPPQNEFEVGQKLEATDPRNTSSTCIATVVDTLGPRIRLRLDGTDDRNDFWLLVDSDSIHPFGHMTAHKGTIQPPLGFRNNLSTWLKFFDKLVQSADENTFARDTCFKPPPPKVPKNEFKKGQKIEAVDQKNPHLICPATIKEVDKDTIYVSFDGWSQASNFRCPYTSRDIFPVGWCKLASHPLQWPGNYDEKKTKRRSGGAATTTTLQQAPGSANNSFSKSNGSSNKNIENINTLNTSKQEAASEQQQQSSVVVNEKSPLKQNINNLNKQSVAIDLSIVKTESTDNFDNFHSKKESAVVNGGDPKGIIEQKEQVNTSNTNNNMQKINPANLVTIYVNPSVNCNKFLNSKKFHDNYKSFGPEIPKNLFKSVLQAFINCAYDSTKIFDRIQDGDSTSYIKFKTASRNERKHLPKIENESQLWINLNKMCQVFDIDENLFVKTSINSKTSSNNNENKNTNGLKPLLPKIKMNKNGSTNRSNSTDASFRATLNGGNAESNNNLNTSKEQNEQNGDATMFGAESINTSKLKRRSSSDDSFTQNKLIKYDADNPQHWNVEQVTNYILNTDSNLASHICTLKDQEIDGKALLLLTTDVMMKYMDMKLGPALKLSNLIEKLKQRH